MSFQHDMTPAQAIAMADMLLEAAASLTVETDPRKSLLMEADDSGEVVA